MHTYKSLHDTRFHFNSDFSGDIVISPKGCSLENDTSISIPAFDLKEFLDVNRDDSSKWRVRFVTDDGDITKVIIVASGDVPNTEDLFAYRKYGEITSMDRIYEVI